MSSGQIKTHTVVSLVPYEDHSESRGFFTKLSGGKSRLVTAATDIPFGAILDGGDVTDQDSVAVSGGNVGSIRVKADGAVSKGGLGQLTAAGKVIADSGAGARVLVCLFLEDGVQDELVEVILIKPISIGHAVVLTSAQNATAAAVDLATTEALANALKANYNQLQIDVAALNTALKAEGRLA